MTELGAQQTDSKEASQWPERNLVSMTSDIDTPHSELAVSVHWGYAETIWDPC